MPLPTVGDPPRVREGAWIAGSRVAALAVCYLAPEYGYSPVPFFSMLFYGAAAGARLWLRMARLGWPREWREYHRRKRE